MASHFTSMQTDFLSNENSNQDKYLANYAMPRFLRLPDLLMDRNMIVSENPTAVNDGWDAPRQWDSTQFVPRYKTASQNQEINVSTYYSQSQPAIPPSAHKPLELSHGAQYDHLLRDMQNPSLQDHRHDHPPPFPLTQEPPVLSPLPCQPGPSYHQLLPYSSTGFDMLKMLAKVASRPNPRVMLGPVDMTCSFAVADARHPDNPLVYASPTFYRLTGYSEPEIIGRNCRFLQSPTGMVHRGEPRIYTAPDAVRHFYRSLLQEKECQASLLNYRKDGSAFLNLVTLIPISEDDSGEITHLVGFQVDLSEYPNAVLQKLRDGSYFVNYSVANVGPGGIRDRRGRGVSNELIHMIRGGSHEPVGRETERNEIYNLMLNNIEDFVHVLSLKGSLLYVAPSISRVLGYDAQELIGKSISDLCHPADVVPVMRELKDASAVPIYQTHSPSRLSYPHDFADPQSSAPPPRPTSLLFRALHKDGHYVWVISRGRLHVEPGKGRKAVVLVGRRIDSGILDAVMTRLLETRVSQPEPSGANGWGLIAPNGIILSANVVCAQRLGFSTTLTIAPSHAFLSANAPAHAYQRYVHSHPDPQLHSSRSCQHHSHDYQPSPAPAQGSSAPLNYYSQIPATLVGRNLGSLIIPANNQEVMQTLINASAYDDCVRKTYCRIRGQRVNDQGEDETFPVEIRFYSTPPKENFTSTPSSIIFEMVFLPEEKGTSNNTLHTFSSLTEYGSLPSNGEQATGTSHYQSHIQTDTTLRTGISTPVEAANTHNYQTPTLSSPSTSQSSLTSVPFSGVLSYPTTQTREVSRSAPQPVASLSMLSSLSVSPTSETSWQYELTRLRFENERMRGELSRLERLRDRYRRAKLNSFQVATSPTSLKRPRSRESESTE